MGRCGATELRGVTAGTTSPAANRLAVRVTPATLMSAPARGPARATILAPTPMTVPVSALSPIPGPRTVPVPALVTALALVSVRVMIPASVRARGCHGEFRGMYRATRDRDERSPGRFGGLPKGHLACVRYSYR
jgi:hypothetical protein